MIEMYVNDIFDYFKIEKNQINIIVVKALIVAMKNRNLCFNNKQKIVFDKEIFIECWNKYQLFLDFFDYNYNRKTDFSLFFKYIIDSLYNDYSMNFHALFCPGYTRYGYKNYLGDTTSWKLSELNAISNMLKSNNFQFNLYCYYSDVFLENCDSSLEPNWFEQLKYNRNLFHEEAKKYFSESQVLNMSDVSCFSGIENMSGFVDKEIILSLPFRTYDAFKKGNEKFYKSLEFTEEQIIFRNDRLITMYKIFSDYLNGLNNSVFLPMENMYERENIFSENNTCTMYLKLKR